MNWKDKPEIADCKRTKKGVKKIDYKFYVNEVVERPAREYKIDTPKRLFLWASTKITKDVEDFYVLDCGAADGSFVEYLSTIVEKALGIEISENFVKHAQDYKRPVILGDVCMLPKFRVKFDMTISCHVLGLVSDVNKALEEMYSVTKKDGYMLILLEVPGNPKKHYTLLEDGKIFEKFAKKKKAEVIHNGQWQYGDKDWVFFIRKNS